MKSIPYSRSWERWAPVVGRVLIGGLFLMGAAFKVPGTQGFFMETGFAASAGLPFAALMVSLAFLVESIGGIAIILGWHARAAACVLAFLTLAFAIIFHSNFADQMEVGQFISHMGLVAGLLFVSVYGAKNFALRKD